ncbi:hypothetical protein M1M07_09780 [Rhodococcus sp. HM1]|uniref:hypothetical protein n=1 Tax=Rhodococcus sp. HM1 TaxID=2937759 RepID=UPI00200B7A23|nr:hypothetical protein [Rhodococcus sp. HM1]MCK8671406.1 hypothetical protein [Rhodococcus sp. HM1]
MQSVRRAARTIPFPFLGYVLGVIGLLFLGGFVGALASGFSFAPVIGIATAALFVGMVACFRIRAHQIAQGNRGDVELSMDPMRPAEDPEATARYLMTYRGTNAPASREGESGRKTDSGRPLAA